MGYGTVGHKDPEQEEHGSHGKGIEREQSVGYAGYDLAAVYDDLFFLLKI